MSGDLVNVEEVRKAREALMRSIEDGDLLIHGMRLDTIVTYVREIRQRGEWSIAQQAKEWQERRTLIEALWECMKHAGADTSYADSADHAYRLGHLPENAIEAVKELRQDYIEGGGG